MKEKNWGVHIEFAVVLITLLGGFFMLDSKIERSICAQSARTDKLYEMFVDLLKERK